MSFSPNQMPTGAPEQQPNPQEGQRAEQELSFEDMGAQLQQDLESLVSDALALETDIAGDKVERGLRTLQEAIENTQRELDELKSESE